MAAFLNYHFSSQIKREQVVALASAFIRISFFVSRVFGMLRGNFSLESTCINGLKPITCETRSWSCHATQLVGRVTWPDIFRQLAFLIKRSCQHVEREQNVLTFQPGQMKIIRRKTYFIRVEYGFLIADRVNSWGGLMLSLYFIFSRCTTFRLKMISRVPTIDLNRPTKRLSDFKSGIAQKTKGISNIFIFYLSDSEILWSFSKKESFCNYCGSTSAKIIPQIYVQDRGLFAYLRHSLGWLHWDICLDLEFSFLWLLIIFRIEDRKRLRKLSYKCKYFMWLTDFRVSRQCGRSIKKTDTFSLESIISNCEQNFVRSLIRERNWRN